MTIKKITHDQVDEFVQALLEPAEEEQSDASTVFKRMMATRQGNSLTGTQGLQPQQPSGEKPNADLLGTNELGGGPTIEGSQDMIKRVEGMV